MCLVLCESWSTGLDCGEGGDGTCWEGPYSGFPGFCNLEPGFPCAWGCGCSRELSQGLQVTGPTGLVPVHGALEYVDDALERQDSQALYQALRDPVLALRRVQRENSDWYLDQLSTDREQKALVSC